MQQPKFSITIIAKNEAHTLPRLFASLEDFKQRGGEVCLLDTGSTDETVKIAKVWGAKVWEGNTFTYTIYKQEAKEINSKFLVGSDSPIVEPLQKIFNFAIARNHINSKASNDMICTLDADEAYTKFDIDAINEWIDKGFEQFEYQFVYAHDGMGRAAVQFVQSKFFDRRKAQWIGIVHEVVTGETKKIYLGEEIIKLEHFQEPGKDHRSNYLPGLAVDCFQNPNKDRQSHYFARELMYSGRYSSAIKKFKHHIEMGGWPAERAQSMIHIGQCYGHLNKPAEQAAWYSKAFYTDSGRRAPLIELALFMRHQDNKFATAAYAAAALQLPWVDYYANERLHYENLPHELLYWALGWMGKIEEAKEHLLKALEYQPYNPNYLRDTKYYFEYPDNEIQGWMTFPELQFLFKEAKKHKLIVEVGSWKGKSTHAICSGNPEAIVVAIDTWEGSADVQDMTNSMAKQEDIFKIFLENTKQFKNLEPRKDYSVEAAKNFEDNSIDWLFIDAGHTKKELAADIETWLPKMKKTGVISGHDYLPGTWMGVIEAVDEKFGKPDSIEGYSIWKIDLNKYYASKQLEDAIYPERNGKSRIPKVIYTCWLSEEEMPEQIKKCIASQKINEYKHITIDLKTAKEIDSKYLQDAMKAKKWVKATDWLRMYYLYKYGGIFLDADVEVLGNFDRLLNEEIFVGKEVNNSDGSIVIGIAIIGAKSCHPLILKWASEVEKNFKGDDDLNYESSMDLLNKLGVDFQDRMKICEPEVFYPYNWMSTHTHITENTITIHHFMKSWVPKIKVLRTIPQTNLESFKNWIEEGGNFAFVKRGDGELACMSGYQGENCDGHKYSPLLRAQLEMAFEYLKDNAIIVEWEDQKNYNILLHRIDNDPSEFFKVIAKSERKKYLIAPSKLTGMAKILNAEYIYCAPKNLFDTYDELLKSIPIEKDAIYMFCASMPAKILIADLMQLNPEATYLDCGSSFDPYISQTRSHQMGTQTFRYIYMNDNFKIPKETHPERVFILKHIEDADEIIYDMGCGVNKTLEQAIGVDIRPVTDIQGSCDKIDVSDSTVDVVISRHSLEHMKDPVRTIKEWIRILKPNGKLLIVLPDHGAIDTYDFKYSNGEHQSAWSIEDFKKFISQFKELYLHNIEVVLKDWSFGVVLEKVRVVQDLPTVDIIIPTLGREDGLQRCIDSIKALKYPQNLISIMALSGNESVPEKMKIGVERTCAEVICYAANDIEFVPDSLLRAVNYLDKYSLIAFNTGPIIPDEGNICEHFIIKRDFVPMIGGEIFCTKMSHVGVDNLLWAKAKKLGQAYRCQEAVVKHYHFSRPGGNPMDYVYHRGWKHKDNDRKILKQELEKI